MQNVGQSDSKKLECKVSVPSTSKATTTAAAMAKYNPAAAPPSLPATANGKNMSSIVTTINNKFASTTSSPIKSDAETYSEFQRISDSSESDEESVSEVCETRKEKKCTFR